MKIKFLGAAGTVTGSGYLVAYDNLKIMIDFGMFQGTPEEEALNFQPLTFDPSQVNALFLTHAHLDHCGRIPLLVNHGFKGPIFATEPTLALAEIVLLDAAKIALSKSFQKPLFSQADVYHTLDLFKIIPYHQSFSFQNLSAKYINAGHILGSASIKIDDGSKSIIFSGDLGSYPDLIVPQTEYFDKADIVIMESTYGGKTHPIDNPLKQLNKIVNSLDKKNGTLLIPSFAIHKTQALLYLIKVLKEQNAINRSLPVFLDSPMAIRVTQEYLARKSDLIVNQFDFPGLVPIYKQTKSRRLFQLNGAKIIIAGSGMMHGGRVLDHAKHMLPKGNTIVLFVGYQGVNTLGREIKYGAKTVHIDDKKVAVNAHIESIESMSSHADEPRLINWLGQINNINTLILTHGEDEARSLLTTRIKKELNHTNIMLPVLNQEISL